MSNLNRDALRKGSAAIEEALESRKSGSGDFRPFLSNIYWKDDQDHRYLMFLNPLEEIPELDFHPFIDCDDAVPHMAIARTDPTIGDSNDPIHDQWNYKPRLTNLAIAVELEPTIELVNRRPKPVGFEVKTLTFERKVRDDEGEDTGEVEEVTVPIVGLVAQSPYNFFNQIKSFDATDAPIHTTPVRITRLGKKENVTYQIAGYDNLKPDLSGLFDNVYNMSYVTEPDELAAAVEAAGEDIEQATIAIGDYLLYRRLEELADPEEYDRILNAITKPAKYGDKPKEEKTERKAKPSQRRQPAEPQATAEDKNPGAERVAELREKYAKPKK